MNNVFMALELLHQLVLHVQVLWACEVLDIFENEDLRFLNLYVLQTTRQGRAA